MDNYEDRLKLNIFSKGVARLEGCVIFPNILDNFDNTPQVVLYATLLTKGSANSDPMKETSDSHLEKEHHQLFSQLVDQFILLPSKDSEILHKVILLAPVLAKEAFINLFNCLYTEFVNDRSFRVDLLLGFTQLMQDAPPNYLQEDDFTKVLRAIQSRLSKSQSSREYLIHLTVAISKVLAITPPNCRGLGLVSTDDTKQLLKVFSELQTQNDPFIKYYTGYTMQALLLPSATDNEFKELSHLSLGSKRDYRKALLKHLTEGGERRLWHLAICEAEMMKRQGQLKELGDWICEVPCCRDPMFLCGVSLLISEVAVDPSWDESTRRQAIGFFGELYRAGVGSKQEQQDMKRWILTILHHIADQPKFTAIPSTSSPLSAINWAIKLQAIALAQELEREDGVTSIITPCMFIYRLPQPLSSRLLQEIKNEPAIETKLEQLRRDRRNDFKMQSIYIQPLSKPNIQSSEDCLDPLYDRTRAFLKGKSEVLLILGDSGSGKSTFCLNLEHQLWDDYKLGEGHIPLFIDLKTIKGTGVDMIHQHLSDQSLFSEDQINEMRRTRRFVLICDGFDERRKWSNLHTVNRLNRPNQWKAKLVISCRTQYLGPNYRNYFEPETKATTSVENQNFSHESPLFEQAVIAPFKIDQIKQYIESYSTAGQGSSHQPIWTTEEYLRRLSRITNMMDLAKNPFMLKMILDVLPGIAQSTTRVTRVELFDKFVAQHFETEFERLTIQRSNDAMDATLTQSFDALKNCSDLFDLGIEFSKRLTQSIFKEGDGTNSINYNVRDEGTWKENFFGSDPQIKLLRESVQLVRRESRQEPVIRLIRHRIRPVRKSNSYEFSHRSILEYYYSRLIFDPSDKAPDLDLRTCLDSPDSPLALKSHPLCQRTIVPESSILHFLAERVLQSQEFKEQLQAIVELSKTKVEVSHAAANAITVLVRAGVRFNGSDLHGIQIPGADLSEGQFDSANLGCANLEGVNLTRAWLRQALLKNAQMKNVQLGEKSYFDAPGLLCCALSEDSKYLAIGLKDGTMQVYEINDWTQTYTGTGHKDGIWSIAFSYSGRWVATGSKDKTVRVWDLKCKGRAIEDTGGLVFSRHNGEVNCLAFSPDDRDRLVFVCSDDLVQEWSPEAGAATTFFQGKHSGTPNGVSWSPDGQHVTTFGDGVIMLWDAESKIVRRRIEAHGLVIAIAFSRDSPHLVASCGNDMKLWDLSADAPPIVLQGDVTVVESVAFSRNGLWIVSACYNGSLWIWDVKTGSSVRSMNGHSGPVQSVLFFNDHEILSGSQDGSARIWELDERPVTSNGRSLEPEGHNNGVFSLSYRPDGKALVSGSQDGTIRLWDVATGNSNVVLITPPGVHKAAYTSCGQQVAVMGADIKLYRPQDEGVFMVPLVQDRVKPGVCMAFSRDGRWMVSGDVQGNVRLWNLENLNVEEQSFEGAHKGWIQRIAFSSGGSQIASACIHQTVRLWDTENMKQPLTLDIEATTFAFSPCDRMMALGNEKSVRIRGLIPGEEGQDVRELPAPFVECLAWSPCGQWIVVGCRDRPVRIFKIVTTIETNTVFCPGGMMIQEFVRPVSSLAWNPASPSEFVTGDWDGSVCVWKIVEEGGYTRVKLRWGSIASRLTATCAVIAGAMGLDTMSRKLLRQRGAYDIPNAVAEVEE